KSRMCVEMSFPSSASNKKEEGKDISTHIRLFVQDRFRQTGVAEKEIRLDALAPNMKLICNEEEITGNTVHFDAIRNIDVRPSESASVSIYVQNGKERVPVSDLGRFLNQMRPLQPATIVFSLLDESGNASEFSYQFHKTVSLIPRVRTIPVQESKKEAVSEETVIPPVVRQNISTSDYQLQQRTYSLDSNNHIVVEKKIVSKVDKPVITVRFFSADDKKVKVLIKKTQNGLKNKVLWIKVNGKKLNLKKIQSDSLGNMIYHIPLKKQKNHIQIKVMNEKGYTKRIEKTIVVQKRTQETDMSLWQRVQSFWIQLKNKIGYV
ncbi:MAG: hypothetical protein J6D18_03155, partial [Erysipelotrichaceae bacterium]|nr:hypothetical protein [Erysipelotrichaceae bacterium]